MNLTSIHIELKGKTCGVLTDLTFDSQIKEPSASADHISGYFRRARFDISCIKDIFYRGHVTVSQQRLPFDIVMNINNTNFILKNVWLTNITGIRYRAEDFVIIADVGPSTPNPKDGRTYWQAEDFIDKNEYKFLSLLQ